MNARSRSLRTLTAALAVAGVALAATAHAREYVYDDTDTWAQGQAVNVRILVDGQAAPLYLSPQGDARRYFEAYAGRNYSLVVRNTTGQRLGVLISVDGLNVVSGDRSRLSPDERMYVLAPYETATISGWRTSLDEVRRFVFVDEKRSYAARTGQANGDMGWVRVLAFREQRPWWAMQPRAKCEDAPAREPRAQGAPQTLPAPVPTGEMKSGRLQAADGLARNEQGGSFPGTGWGDRRNDPVALVEFNPERVAADNLVFRYEYASGLRALGIFRDDWRDGRRLRDRDNGQLGFAKPPRW